MKSIKRVTMILPILAAIVLALAVWAGYTPPVSVSAEEDFSYEITRYDIAMDVSSDRVVTVTEEFTVQYLLRGRHGIYRDLSLDNGIRYENVSAMRDGGAFRYSVQTEDMFLRLLLGDENGATMSTERPYVYTVNYTMRVPALSEEGYLPLGVVAYYWRAAMRNVTARITLPQGLREYKVYSGFAGTTGNDCAEAVLEGNELTVTAAELPIFRGSYAAGINVDFKFEAGALTTRADLTPLWAALFGAAMLAAIILVKVFLIRQPVLVKTVNLTAPNEMDPLLMGKLVDNKLDGEDYGALVFWLASKGYLHIDLTENPNDPVLYKSEKPLEGSVPEHCRLMYNALFQNRECVRISALKNNFYKTAEAMKANVDARTGKMYKTKIWATVLGFLIPVLLGGFAFLYAFLAVSRAYLYWGMWVGCLVPFFVAAVTIGEAQRRKYKWKKPVFVLASVGGFLLAAVVGVCCCLIPCAAFGFLTQLILVLFSLAAGAVFGFFTVRTEEYNEKLGHILGFKDFILYTEKDKIEFMLKENPALYYDILPYAQVLGITNAWTGKFKGLQINPPVFANYGAGNLLFDCFVWNTLFRTLNADFGRSMMSRPSSSGTGRIGGGFRGGGFGGGGFGSSGGGGSF